MDLKNKNSGQQGHLNGYKFTKNNQRVFVLY